MNKYQYDGYFTVTLNDDSFYNMNKKCNQITYESDVPIVFFKQLNIHTQEFVLLLAVPVSQIKVIEHIDAADVWSKEKEKES